MPTHPLHSAGRPAETGPPPLRLVFWETTTACNLACAHCRRLEVSRELARDDLTTDEGRRLIDQIAEVGMPILVFSGGEPLMRPDWFELAGYARERGLPTALATNGTMVDAPLAARIVEAGFRRVSVSLDGAGPPTHDLLRQQPGSFDAACAALRALRAAGMSTQINCTIARHNEHELEAVLRLGETLGADAVHFFLLVPVGCGEQIADDQMLSAEDTERRLRELYSLAERTTLEVKATCAPHYYRIVRQQPAAPDAGGDAAGKPRPRAHGRGCLAGTAVCFVSHKGDVFPCGYLPTSAGNVRTTSFARIWAASDLFAVLRDPSLLTGKCGLCEFRGVCGGCRARAFYQYGDYLAEEPFCAYEPARRADRGRHEVTPPTARASTPPAERRTSAD